MTMMLESAWVAKARALDRYRWLLLRERHGFIGSAMRFAREAVLDWVFGLRARLCRVERLAPTPCDFLLLQSAPKVIAFKRKQLLIEALRAKGYNLVETALDTPGNILSARQLKRPVQPVPLRYYGYAAYAEWLVCRYSPKILLNDRNGSLYAPFLRLSLNARERLLVHLAHASTVESSRRLGMNDYDYYFLFGRSSLDALLARTLRFGTSKAVLAGSHMVDGTYDLGLPAVTDKTALLLGVGPDKEKESQYLATYAVVLEWARSNPGYRVLVKRHPRSRAEYWERAAQEVSCIELLPADCSLATALERASLVINIMSNAVIEAGLAKRPIIYLNATAEADVLAQERFLGPPVKTANQLSKRVVDVEATYEEMIAQAQSFSQYHLTQGVAGLAYTVELLAQLYEGQDAGLAYEILPNTIERNIQ